MARVIKLLLYYFASQLCATSLALAGYAGWHYIKSGTLPVEWGLPFSLSLAANIASIAFMVWILLRNKYLIIDKEAINPGKTTSILLYSAIGITAMIWLNFISDIMDLPDWFKSTFSMMQEDIVGIITMAIIAPIFEEMLFRGAIEGHLLKKWKNPRYAILVSALIFGIVHLNPAQILFAFLFGLILGDIYFRTKSLSAVIILHFINNTISVIIMFLFPEYDKLTDLLGFNTMACLSLISFIAFIFLMKIFKKRFSNKAITD